MIKYALILIWLALTGSFAGWGQPALLVINGWLAADCLVGVSWRLWYGRSLSMPLSGPLLTYLLVATGITLFLGNAGQSLFRLYYILILIAIYHLPVNVRRVRRGAWLAGWVVFPLAVLFRWDNPNPIAMSVWGVYFLGIDWDDDSPARIGFTLLAILALAVSASEGAMLAMLAGGLFWFWDRLGRRYGRHLILALALVGIVTVAAKIIAGHVGSWATRVEIYQVAVTDFLRSPWIGHGVDGFHTVTDSGSAIWEQHNLLLTIAWETGLVGLGLLAWLIARIRQLVIPTWAGAWLSAFVVHSLVDGPLYINFLSAVGLMIVLGGLTDAREKSYRVGSGYTVGGSPHWQPAATAGDGDQLGRVGVGQPGPRSGRRWRNCSPVQFLAQTDSQADPDRS